MQLRLKHLRPIYAGGNESSVAKASSFAKAMEDWLEDWECKGKPGKHAFDVKSFCHMNRLYHGFSICGGKYNIDFCLVGLEQ